MKWKHVLENQNYLINYCLLLICFKIERGKYQGNFFLAIYIHIPLKFVRFIFWIFLTSHTFATLVFNQFACPTAPPPKKKSRWHPWVHISELVHLWWTFVCSYHRRRKDRHEASGFSRRPDPDSDEDEDYERERRKRSKAWTQILCFKRGAVPPFHIQFHNWFIWHWFG